jgi:hypothetical protein
MVGGNGLFQPLRALLQDGIPLEGKVHWNHILETYIKNTDRCSGQYNRRFWSADVASSFVRAEL